MRIFILVLSLLVYQLGNAATKTWTGNTSTNWATATNWSGNSLPGSGDDVTIPTSPSGGRMPTISADYTVRSITIQTGATLTQTGGILSVLAGDLVVEGTYAISAGTFLSDKTFTVSTNGSVLQSGGIIHMATSTGTNPTDHIVIEANGVFSFSGGTIKTKDLTTNNGTPDGAFNQTGGTIAIYHDFKNKGAFNASGGTIEFAGDGGGAAFPADVTSANTQFNNVQINAGVNPGFDNQVISFNVAGNWTNNSSGIDLSPKASTVIFNGAGSQSIGGSQSTLFRNMTINKTSGIAVLSADQSIKNGNLSITGGTFDLDTYTFNRSSAGGTLTLSNGSTLKLAANTGGQPGSNFPLDFTTVSLGSTSTVEYDGLQSITQTIYNGATYGHLLLTNGSGSGSAPKITTSAITVNGNLTVNTATVLTPAAANTVGGSGTLMGSGTVRVTRTAATADFNTQYSISNKTLTSLTVDYFASAAQTVNALNYFNLTISGTRTTNSVTLANTGTIGVSGTFTPSASFTSGNYILTNSTVDFNGSTQNIPTFTFNHLTVSNGAKTATGVINVNGAFTLNTAILTTTATNLLVLKDNATTSGAGLTSYVNGPVRKIGNDAFTFPVGKSGTGYMSIGISAPSLATDAFTAEYMRSSATALGPIVASGLVRVSNCDYWNLDRTTGSSSVNVTLSWNGYSNCNVAAYVNDLSSLTVAHFNGTTWDSHGKNASTGTVSSGTVTWNSVSAFSPFTIGSTNDYANPLRVDFTSIAARKYSGVTRVDWTNLAETGVDHYEIERAVGNGPFSKAGEVKAIANDGNNASYHWLDHASFNGEILYRVRAVGKDGHVVYSSTVRIDTENKQGILIYPNPVEGGNLNLYTGGAITGNYQVQVVDMNGRLIKTQVITQQNGTAAVQVIGLPPQLKPGIYSLRVSSPNYNQSKTFMVK